MAQANQPQPGELTSAVAKTTGREPSAWDALTSPRLDATHSPHMAVKDHLEIASGHRTPSYIPWLWNTFWQLLLSFVRFPCKHC
jgi:hypothetical protein